MAFTPDFAKSSQSFQQMNDVTHDCITGPSKKLHDAKRRTKTFIHEAIPLGSVS